MFYTAYKTCRQILSQICLIVLTNVILQHKISHDSNYEEGSHLSTTPYQIGSCVRLILTNLRIFRIWSCKGSFQNIPAEYMSCPLFSGTVRRARSSSQLQVRVPASAGNISYREFFSRLIFYLCMLRLRNFISREIIDILSI